MDLGNREIILIYALSLSIVIALSIIFREKFWHRFGSWLFPILLGVLIIFNLFSFPAINQPYFNWAYQGHLQRLPSNQLIDLFQTSGSPLRADWIYPFVEDYYQGRKLLIPENLTDSLELNQERLLSQSRLAVVETIAFNGELTKDEVEMLLDLETVSIPTRVLNSEGNITKEQGDVYHFVLGEKDASVPVLLLKHENQFFFVPLDHVPEKEDAS